MEMVMAVVVPMIVIGVGADAAHMMVVAGLRGARLVLITNDLSPILAELAVHRWLAISELHDTVSERAKHSLMVAQV